MVEAAGVEPASKKGQNPISFTCLSSVQSTSGELFPVFPGLSRAWSSLPFGLFWRSARPAYPSLRLSSPFLDLQAGGGKIPCCFRCVPFLGCQSHFGSDHSAIVSGVCLFSGLFYEANPGPRHAIEFNSNLSNPYAPFSKNYRTFNILELVCQSLLYVCHPRFPSSKSLCIPGAAALSAFKTANAVLSFVWL